MRIGTRWRTVSVAVGAAASALTMAGQAHSATCQSTWDAGGDGTRWSDAANWSADLVPSASQHACVPDVVGTPTIVVDSSFAVASVVSAERVRIDGTLTLTSALDTSSISALDMFYGTLAGAGSLDVSGSMAFSGHAWGSGRIRILSGGHLELAGGNVGRTIRVEGSARWPNGTVTFYEGGRIDNAGTFDAIAHANMYRATSGADAGVFVNSGSLTKTSGADSIASFGIPIHNNGTISVAAGWLALDGGTVDTPSVGDFGTPAVQGGELILRNGNFRLAEGAALRGRTSITGGLVANGRVTVGGTSDLRGALGGPGQIDVEGTLRWSAGGMWDAGTTRVTPTGRLDIVSSDHGGTATLYLGRGRRVRNEGVIDWVGHSIAVHDGARIENVGTFDARSQHSMYRTDGSAEVPVFANRGTLTRSSGVDTTTSIDMALDNDGVIEASTGHLILRGSGDLVSTGRYGTTGKDGHLWLERGTFTLGDGAKLAGNTHLRSIVSAAGAVVVEGESELQGELTGPGVVSVAGSLRWVRGAMGGSGETRVLPAGRLLLDFACCNAELWRDVVNQGTISWTSGSLPVADGVVISNPGTFDAVSPGGVLSRREGGAAVPELRNTGRITRSVGADTATTIDMPVHNAGVVEAERGWLRLGGGGTDVPATGRFGSPGEGTVVIANRTLRAGTGTIFDGTVDLVSTLFLTGPVRVDGTLRQAGTVDGPGTLDVAGALEWNAGSMIGTGSTRTLPGSRFTIQHPGHCCSSVVTHRNLSLGGATRWLSGDMYVGDGVVIENKGTFDLVAPNWTMRRFHGGADYPRFVNLGTLTRSVGPESTTYLDFPLENDGTVALAAGKLRVHSRFTQSVDGILRVQAMGSAAMEDFGVLSVAGPARLGGQLEMQLDYAPEAGELLRVTELAAHRGQFTLTGTSPPGRTLALQDRQEGVWVLVGAVAAGVRNVAPVEEDDPAEPASAPEATDAPPVTQEAAAAPAPVTEKPGRLVVNMRVEAAAGHRIRASRIAGRTLRPGERLRVKSGPRAVSVAAGGRELRVGRLEAGSTVHVRVQIVLRGRAVGRTRTVVLTVIPTAKRSAVG